MHADLETTSPWIAQFAGLIVPGGKVLDLACGGGRHAIYLANRGMMVLAVDRDAESLNRIQHDFVMPQQMDLEGELWPLPESEFGKWNAIVVSNYLYRPHLDQLPGLLEEGGILLYETFAIGNEEFGKPSNPNFLLQPGELLDLAKRHDLHVVAYQDGYRQIPKPAMVQSLCASRGLPKIRIPLQFNA